MPRPSVSACSGPTSSRALRACAPSPPRPPCGAGTRTERTDELTLDDWQLGMRDERAAGNCHSSTGSTALGSAARR